MSNNLYINYNNKLTNKIIIHIDVKFISTLNNIFGIIFLNKSIFLTIKFIIVFYPRN